MEIHIKINSKNINIINYYKQFDNRYINSLLLLDLYTKFPQINKTIQLDFGIECTMYNNNKQNDYYLYANTSYFILGNTYIYTIEKQPLKINITNMNEYLTNFITPSWSISCTNFEKFLVKIV